VAHTAPRVSLAANPLLLSGILLALLLMMSLWIGRAPLTIPLWGMAAAILFLATLLNSEAGLIILILSMLLSPEIPLGGAGGSGLEGTRSVVLRTEDLVLLLVGLAWVARMAIHKDLGAVRRTPINVALAAYVACCLISTLFGVGTARVSPLVGFCYVAKYVEYFIIFFMTVNYVRDEARLHRLLGAVLVTAGLIVAYAWWQMPSGVRPSAPVEGARGEPNTLGGYLVMVICVGAAIAMTDPRRSWRRACGLLAVAAVPPLLATLSRSSWLALAAALLTLLAFGEARRRLAAALILGVTLLLLLQPAAVERRVAQTFGGTADDAVRVGRVRLDSSASARISSWGEALTAFTRHPVLGWGITGYGFLDAQYFRVLVELGVVGFAAFAGLIIALARLFLSAWRTPGPPLRRALGLGMGATLAGLLVHAIGANTFLLIRIMEPFWLLTALVAATMAPDDQESLAVRRGPA